jgi:hypothetical protein
MTRDEVIALARECQDVPLDDSTTNVWVLFTEQLEHFAARAAAAEREACAQVCDDLERKKWETITTGGELTGVSARDCAAAIRRRHDFVQS